jgi:hypothetical protein
MSAKGIQTFLKMPIILKFALAAETDVDERITLK